MSLGKVWKANVGGLVTAAAAIVTALATGEAPDPTAIEEGSKALEAVISGVVGLVVGWVAVYVSPKNEQ